MWLVVNRLWSRTNSILQSSFDICFFIQELSSQISFSLLTSDRFGVARNSVLLSLITPKWVRPSSKAVWPWIKKRLLLSRTRKRLMAEATNRARCRRQACKLHTELLKTSWGPPKPNWFSTHGSHLIFGLKSQDRGWRSMDLPTIMNKNKTPDDHCHTTFHSLAFLLTAYSFISLLIHFVHVIILNQKPNS